MQTVRYIFPRNQHLKLYLQHYFEFANLIVRLRWPRGHFLLLTKGWKSQPNRTDADLIMDITNYGFQTQIRHNIMNMGHSMSIYIGYKGMIIGILWYIVTNTCNTIFIVDIRTAAITTIKEASFIVVFIITVAISVIIWIIATYKNQWKIIYTRKPEYETI